MLTISLGLGAAIVPLVLLGGSLLPEDKISLSIASVVLLLNSVYLVIVMKNRTEALSISSTLDGMEERLLMVKLRNLLTKAILTKEEDYFIEYNKTSRVIAEESVNKIDGIKWTSLNYSTDISSSAMVIASLLVLKPVLPINDTIYFVLFTVAFTSLVWWFKALNSRYSHLNKRAEELNKQGIEEEKNLNAFVRLLSESEKE